MNIRNKLISNVSLMLVCWYYRDEISVVLPNIPFVFC